MTTPTPVISNGVTLTVSYSVAGQVAQNVLGGYVTDVGTGLSTTEAARWRDAWWNAVRSLLPGAVTCTGAILRDRREVDAQVYEVGAPATPAGTDSGSLSVAAAGGLIVWRTAFGGRSGRGRTFLPGIGEADVDTNGRTIASAYATRMQTAIDAYLGSMEPADGNVVPAVISERVGNARQITSGSPASILGMQRRRMR
jgi:hypothetical protein